MDKKSFADLYAQWESSHDESSAIEKRVKTGISKPQYEITITQLRNMKVQDELDLHNLLLEDAIVQTKAFLDSSWHKGFRKVRIITGKGLHSPNGESVIRPAIIGLVKNDSHVREADYSPKASDGGSGAIIVILKK